IRVAPTTVHGGFYWGHIDVDDHSHHPSRHLADVMWWGGNHFCPSNRAMIATRTHACLCASDQ
ncbi:MAG TPA: hypothetical protein PLZ51_29540, partial [Aggregatilineales bacterium]|nr:hypothetical protein [Aggregatilineales bacterium]